MEPGKVGSREDERIMIVVFRRVDVKVSQNHDFGRRKKSLGALYAYGRIHFGFYGNLVSFQHFLFHFSCNREAAVNHYD